jgi:hypothetical protein
VGENIMDLILFAKMKKYVDDTVAGVGSLQGKSAYDIAVQGGFQGSEAEWLESLKGTTPHIGENGNWYVGEEDTGVSALPPESNMIALTTEEILKICK